MLRVPKVGDVYRAPSGRLRIVRAVHPSREPNRTRVFFAIAHCSWTHRCYTLYTLSELKTLGYTLTRAHYDVKDKFQKLFVEDVNNHELERNFHCCDVVGIP
jgi:hypothetical protein